MLWKRVEPDYHYKNAFAGVDWEQPIIDLWEIEVQHGNITYFHTPMDQDTVQDSLLFMEDNGDMYEVQLGGKELHEFLKQIGSDMTRGQFCAVARGLNLEIH